MHGVDHPASSLRNAGPILGVLRHELAGAATLLEIGSGTACHATSFAGDFPGLQWQTSDLEANHRDIEAAIAEAGRANVLPPMALDMHEAVAGQQYDVVYSCNTAHIMSGTAAKRMIDFVVNSLGSGGRFIYYGPFRRAGRFSTESNAAFDMALRSGQGDMGLRELDDLDARAAEGGLVRMRTYAMPFNNLLVVWERQ